MVCFEEGRKGFDTRKPHYTRSVLVPLVFCPRFRHSTFNCSLVSVSRNALRSNCCCCFAVNCAPPMLVLELLPLSPFTVTAAADALAVVAVP